MGRGGVSGSWRGKRFHREKVSQGPNMAAGSVGARLVFEKAGKTVRCHATMGTGASSNCWHMGAVG